MKKTLAVILTLIMLFALIPMSYAAEASGFTLVITGGELMDNMVQRDGKRCLQVGVAIDGPSDEKKLDAVDFKLTYDKNQLTFVDAELIEDMQGYASGVNAGEVKVALACTEGVVPGRTHLARVYFELKDEFENGEKINFGVKDAHASTPVPDPEHEGMLVSQDVALGKNFGAFVAPTGHKWGDPVYTWSRCHDELTATMTCEHYDTHVRTETVETTAEFTDAPAPGKEVSATFSASFSDPAYAPQTITVTTGWVKYQGNIYYLLNGVALAGGFKKIEGTWYYFNADGTLLYGGFFKKLGKYYYYIENDGAIAMGWLKLEQPDGTVKTYYCGSNGVVRFKWQKIEGKYYYFGKNGVMRANGFKKIGKKYYYFTEDGFILMNGFKKVNGKYYYFNKNGTVAFGWKKIGKKTYYCGTNGVVRFKWQKISGKWYYFGTNGVMLYSTSKKIDGKVYKFNSKGVCTNKK